MDAPSAAAAGPAQKISIYTRDNDAAGVLRLALNAIDGTSVQFRDAGAPAALKDIGESGSPALLVVDLTGEDDPVAVTRDLVSACDPATALVILGEANDIRLYRNILQAGAREYFFKPLVTALINRTFRMALSGQADPQHANTGAMVFVVGVRGGCGATTIAARLAWRLSESPPRPVLMLDLDLQGGDQAMLFDATPNHALSEALAQPDRVDDLFLERALIPITKRLDLLASLEPLHAQNALDEPALLALLDRVTRRYRYVVTDVPSLAAPQLSQTLHLPSTLLLISDGRLVSAREVARWREWLGVDSAERMLLHVLNMSGAPGSLSLADFTRAAGRAPDAVIPYAKSIASGSVLGIMNQADLGPLDRALGPVLAMLAGETVVERKTWLQKLWR